MRTRTLTATGLGFAAVLRYTRESNKNRASPFRGLASDRLSA